MQFKLEKEPSESNLQMVAAWPGMGMLAIISADYLRKIGLENIQAHEIKLNKKITEAMADKVELLGPKDAAERGSIFSFNVPGMELHNVAIMLDEAANIMLRSGAHCCHSWFNANKLQGSVRASVYLYNTEEECDVFIEELQKIIKFLS